MANRDNKLLCWGLSVLVFSLSLSTDSVAEKLDSDEPLRRIKLNEAIINQPNGAKDRHRRWQQQQRELNRQRQQTRDLRIEEYRQLQQDRESRQEDVDRSQQRFQQRQNDLIRQRQERLQQQRNRIRKRELFSPRQTN